MWTVCVLSIIVKNMQSYIVAIVWGIAEVFSLFKMREMVSSKRVPSNHSYPSVSTAAVTPSDGVGVGSSS